MRNFIKLLFYLLFGLSIALLNLCFNDFKILSFLIYTLSFSLFIYLTDILISNILKKRKVKQNKVKTQK